MSNDFASDENEEEEEEEEEEEVRGNFVFSRNWFAFANRRELPLTSLGAVPAHCDKEDAERLDKAGP